MFVCMTRSYHFPFSKFKNQYYSDAKLMLSILGRMLNNVENVFKFV